MPVQACGLEGVADVAFLIPPGTEYDDCVPGLAQSPELRGQAGSLVVLYKGSVGIAYLTGIPGVPRDDIVEGAVCVVTPDGQPNVYSNVTREGLFVPPGALKESVPTLDDDAICVALPRSPTCS